MQAHLELHLSGTYIVMENQLSDHFCFLRQLVASKLSLLCLQPPHTCNVLAMFVLATKTFQCFLFH